MRSFTTADLPGRCKRCWIRTEFCVCGDVREVTPRTHVVVVRHIRESWKSTGTARAAQIGIPSLSCLEYGEDGRPALDQLPELCTEGTFVLFPGTDAQPWSGQPVKRLVLLDGTWRQSRRMYHRLPALHGLPKLVLPPKSTPVLRLRESDLAEGRSTLEALADALELIEGPEVGTALTALHALFVERVLRARGVWDQRTAVPAEVTE